MRELKFRAWSTHNKVMYHRVLAGPGDPCSIVWSEQGKEWVQFDEACGAIMQYTELKDKHDVEVYEGDIVRAIVRGRDGAVEEIQEVKIVDGLLVPFYLPVFYSEYYWKKRLEDGFEIIGNVFEHPELLQGK